MPEPTVSAMTPPDAFHACFLCVPACDLAQATLDLPASPGLCLFADPNDRPILLLAGADLRRLVRRRLQSPLEDAPSRRTRLQPVVHHVYWRTAWSHFETQWAYFSLARALYPDSFRDLLGRPHAWLLALDPANPWPTFDLTDSPLAPGRRYWGPFPSRKAANACLDILQDLFDLCRCPHRLRQSGQADCVTDCPYVQMNRCAGAPHGRLEPKPYRLAIDHAAAFLGQPLAHALAQIEQRMNLAAANLQFEQAQRHKTQLQRAQALRGPTARWAMPLADFAVFSFQPGPPQRHARRKIPTLTPFLLLPHGLIQLPPAAAEDLPHAAAALVEKYHNRPNPADRPQPFDPDALAWATQLLYRPPDPRGLLVSARDLDDAESLTARIRQSLGNSPPPRDSSPPCSASTNDTPQ